MREVPCLQTKGGRVSYPGRASQTGWKMQDSARSIFEGLFQKLCAARQHEPKNLSRESDTYFDILANFDLDVVAKAFDRLSKQPGKMPCAGDCYECCRSIARMHEVAHPKQYKQLPPAPAKYPPGDPRLKASETAADDPRWQVPKSCYLPEGQVRYEWIDGQRVECRVDGAKALHWIQCILEDTIKWNGTAWVRRG